MKHITKQGEEINICDMENSHLINTINLFKKKASEGISVMYGGGYGGDIDSFYCDVEVYHGRKAEEYLNLDAYIKEAKKRNLL